MRSFNVSQRRTLSDFLMTIAAGWFGAGVIATVFARPMKLFEAIINVALGVFLAFGSLSFVLYLEKRRK